MTYREFLPATSLRSYIECYWMITSSPGETLPYNTIYPDACIDIIFNFGGSLVSKKGETLYINSYRSFVVGNMTRAVLSRPEAHYDLLGVRFCPGGFYAFTKIPTHELTDLVVAGDQFRFFDEWAERLVNCDTQERCNLLDTLFMKTTAAIGDKATHYCINRLLYTRGIYRIADLSIEAGISQKQLERKFKNIVGLTPKQLARIIQFKNMQHLLRAKCDEESLLQLSIDGGYADHAHFTKAFKEFSGVLPSEYLLMHRPRH